MDNPDLIPHLSDEEEEINDKIDGAKLKQVNEKKVDDEINIHKKLRHN